MSMYDEYTDRWALVEYNERGCPNGQICSLWPTKEKAEEIYEINKLGEDKKSTWKIKLINISDLEYIRFCNNFLMMFNPPIIVGEPKTEQIKSLLFGEIKKELNSDYKYSDIYSDLMDEINSLKNEVSDLKRELKELDEELFDY